MSVAYEQNLLFEELYGVGDDDWEWVAGYGEELTFEPEIEEVASA